MVATQFSWEAMTSNRIDVSRQHDTLLGEITLRP